jgi:hypothetical protein
LAQAVLAQAQAQLGLTGLEVISTVVEKRATFACTPGLLRPGMQPLAGEDRLLVCGDYVAGPYPATLEAALVAAQAVDVLPTLQAQRPEQVVEAPAPQGQGDEVINTV